MTKHKVSELEGALLDAAVAKAHGMHAVVRGEGLMALCINAQGRIFEPSCRWDVGGPIIERERIAVMPCKAGWAAYLHPTVSQNIAQGLDDGQGSTPLIAAMRAFVASKLGEEAEL
jgi:hypothetical protein